MWNCLAIWGDIYKYVLLLHINLYKFGGILGSSINLLLPQNKVSNYVGDVLEIYGRSILEQILKIALSKNGLQLLS